MKLVEPNAMVVLGYMRDLYVKTGRKDEWPAAEAELKAGDYKHLCDTAKRLSYGSIEVVRADNDDEMED